MVAFTATTIAESSLTTFYNKDTISDTSLNGNFNAIKNRVNTVITEVSTLAPSISQTQTWTAAQTFNANTTFQNIYFTATYGIGDQFLLMDAANTGATRDQSIRFYRGTTSATPARITYDSANQLYRFSTNADTTLAVIRIADGAASTDGMSYGQGVKLTGTVAETITGVKTFGSYPLLLATYAAPTTDLQAAPKKYVDDQTSGLVTGGILQQTSAPAVTNNNLWIDTTSTGNYKFFRANGTRFDPVTGIHMGTTAPTTPSAASGHLWIDTTSTTNPQFNRYDGTTWQHVFPGTTAGARTFSGAITMSSTLAVTGAITATGGWVSGASVTLNANSNRIINVTDPTAAQDAATKNYVDTNITNVLWGDTSDGARTIAGTETLTQDGHWTTLTVPTGTTLDTGGYKIFCNTLAGAGTIRRNGGNGGNGGNASGGTGGSGGTAGTAAPAGSFPIGIAGQTGGAGASGVNGGGAGVAGAAATTTAGASAGTGGAGGTVTGQPGGAGGAAGTNTTSTERLRDYLGARLGWQTSTGSLVAVQGRTGSGSGGGGGSNQGSTGGGGGGGSGANGGHIFIAARTITFTGTITSTGGNGGNGGTGNGGADQTGGGGGGASGCGGTVVVIYRTLTGGGYTVTVTAGTVGTGGAGGGGSASGANGVAGSAGQSITIAAA